MRNQKVRLLRRFRPSFTLVELLVAMAIIGSMVGMVLFALAGARQDANISRTKHTIEKLNAVILQEWEEFRYRAVNVQVDPQWLRPSKQAGMVGQPPLSPREGARLRMLILRDWMRMELPDRVTDIWYPPTAYKTALFTANNPGGTVNDDLPYYAGANGAGIFPGERKVPSRLNLYRRRLGLGAFPSPYPGAVAPVPATLPPAVNGTNQGAEMLYQIVATSTYQGGAALEAFRPQEIGDTDGDGMPEFIDAWGNPIRWLRWPAGFPSPLNDPSEPDAMDPLRTDWRWSDNSVMAKPWLLVPLIISAGPDGVFDVSFDKNPTVVYATQTWAGPTSSPAYGQVGPYFYPDPYFGVYSGGGALGALFDEDGDGTTRGAADNISNHSLLLE
ncbi:MAG: type II secretion system protein [Planctomycetota bacterium]|nr:MAG: type II secretion system protein [Planctomycetota bacterium]